jgi:hypothetical protein
MQQHMIGTVTENGRAILYCRILQQPVCNVTFLSWGEQLAVTCSTLGTCTTSWSSVALRCDVAFKLEHESVLRM